jgi:hypothetical protein
MKRFLTIVYLICALGMIAWGIDYLETMRRESAEENRRITEEALQQQNEDDWLD